MTVAPAGAGEVLSFRGAEARDGAEVWRFVRDLGVLELNSAYCYLLMFEHHGKSCLIAEAGDELTGFVLAYRLPDEPSTLFVWQIGVAPSMRGRGLGRAMLTELLRREASADVRFVEASVTESNEPSQRLFRSLARELDTECVVSPFLPDHLFPEPHESESLLRIGPIARGLLTTVPRRSR